MTYRTKELTVEAIKIRRTTETQLELMSMGVEIVMWDTDYLRTEFTVCLRYKGKTVKVNGGDYIMVVDDQIYAVPCEVFKQVFQ